MEKLMSGFAKLRFFAAFSLMSLALWPQISPARTLETKHMTNKNFEQVGRDLRAAIEKRMNEGGQKIASSDGSDITELATRFIPLSTTVVDAKAILLGADLALRTGRASSSGFSSSSPGTIIGAKDYQLGPVQKARVQISIHPTSGKTEALVGEITAFIAISSL